MKIKNNEICLQKFSVENCKTKEEFQLQIELFTREKEGLQRSHEKAILDLNELLEKSKKVFFSSVYLIFVKLQN